MSFQITYRDGAYYVSIPNYSGGEVVDAAKTAALVKALEGARKHISHCDDNIIAVRLLDEIDAALAAYRKDS